MPKRKVLRRIDAPHIFFGWNPHLASCPEMEEAWLNSETGKTSLTEHDSAPPRAAPPPKRRPGRPKKAVPAEPNPEPKHSLPRLDLSDLEAGLPDDIFD